MATDISDKTWDDLYEADHSILRELAGEIDALNGNAAREEICVGLMQYHDREGEVPEEYAEYLENSDDTASDSQADTESDDGDETEGGETGDSDDATEGETQVADDGEDSEPDTDGDEEGEGDGFQTGNEYEPSRDEQFIIEASVLQEWLDHLVALVEEAKIHLTREGWQTRAVEPANVAMAEGQLEERAFESYDVPEEGVIGVNINRVADIVGGAQADDLVNVEYDATTRNLVLAHGGHEFTVSLIDPDSVRSEPDLPDLDLPVDLTIEAEKVKTAVGYADNLSDHVDMATTPEGVFSIRAEGDTDSYEGEFEDVDVALHPAETKRSKFAADYLKSVLNAIDGERALRIRHGQEYPIWLDADVGDEGVGHVHYMIAPRIQSG